MEHEFYTKEGNLRTETDSAGAAELAAIQQERDHLSARFALGEIKEEEYRAKLAELENNPQGVLEASKKVVEMPKRKAA